MNNTHIMADGTIVQHRWVHNAYGALQIEATYKGLLMRDNYQLRPFVLTRSFFFGSQKFGAMWCGDSQSIYDDIPATLNMLLANSVSGIIFGGSDLPGFAGIPEEDLWVQEYQIGVFYPFFRAHANKDTLVREPWL